MNPARFCTATRLLLALTAGAALPGCAVYGPPYAYDPAPAVAPLAPPLSESYYAYPYGYGYG